MALARFKDLCIDATDADRMARFWADVLGLRYVATSEPVKHLTGRTPEHGVWVNPVPEVKTVKHRVHLDVHAASVEAVEELGAVRQSGESEFSWTVVADPEGGELCVFERAEVPDYRMYEVVVDSVEPSRIAHWWANVLGAHLGHDEKGFSYVDEIPEAPFESFVFGPVPEPKTVKNRVHWDVDAVDVQPLLHAGARMLREPDDEIGWHVLADPEGNEFCVFTS